MSDLNVIIKKIDFLVTKFLFYVENVTKLNGFYKITATNYQPADCCCFHNIFAKTNMKKVEDFWEKACLEGCGIVIDLEKKEGCIGAFEKIQVNLMIYANTWGSYLEEIMVEIDDLVPFCFNLLVEVEGLPIEFPFARNTTLDCPTLRFENVSYDSKKITKNVSVVNVSSIPIEISWNCYALNDNINTPSINLILEFNNNDLPELVLSKIFYGSEANCVKLTPSIFTLNPKQNLLLSININTNSVVPSTSNNLKFNLIGFYSVAENYKIKKNYFQRLTGLRTKPAQLKLSLSIEFSHLKFHILPEDTKLNFFANDLLFEKIQISKIFFFLQNVDGAPVEILVKIDKPFRISKLNKNEDCFILQGKECLQICLDCCLSCEEILQIAEDVYKGFSEAEQNFVATIRRDFLVYQMDELCQKLPFEVSLHYPSIRLSTRFIKFGNCLIYCTKKAILTIYNNTGAEIRFEIAPHTSASSDDEFEANPTFGKINCSTGANLSFVDISIYFSPKKCKNYTEKLKIMTNIPQYFLEVAVSGCGVIDEKFFVS